MNLFLRLSAEPRPHVPLRWKRRGSCVCFVCFALTTVSRPPLFLLSWEPVGSCCFPATVLTRSFPFAQLSAQGMRASAAGHRFIPTVIHLSSCMINFVMLK
nr:MAG TPA: hypothetical protein [Caudoviricetes sp.]